MRTYTATFLIPAFATQVKTVAIPATDPSLDPGDNPGEEQPGDPGTDPVSAVYYCAEGDGTEWTKGSTEGATFVFKCQTNDDQAFGHFTGIEIDGQPVDSSNYTAVSGSVVVTLAPAYLQSLAEGAHNLMANFDDGAPAPAMFTVKAASSGTDPVTPGADPAAGGSGNDSKSGSGTSGATNNGSGSAKTVSGGSSSASRSSGSASASHPVLPRTGDATDGTLVVPTLLAAVAFLITGVAVRRRMKRA